MTEIKTIGIGGIQVHNRMRALQPEVVKTLMVQMKEDGKLLPPLTVRRRKDGGYYLIAGFHRLKAALNLKREEVDVIIVDCDEEEAEGIEIRENLERAELTVLERAHHIDLLSKLESRKHISAQVAQADVYTKGGRPKSGDSLVARQLGITRDDVRRNVKIASITLEAKKAAIEAGIDNNQTALLEIAKKPKDDQIEVIEEIAAQHTSCPLKEDAEAVRPKKERLGWLERMKHEIEMQPFDQRSMLQSWIISYNRTHP